MNGRKRHIVVDTVGLLLVVVVHAACVQDRDGGRLAIEQLRGKFQRLRMIWADGGYAGQFVEWAQAAGTWIVEIVKRSDVARGFEVLPKRWIVERTFAWIGRYRRMSKDYEMLTVSSESMIRIAMINLMLHRLQPG
jgi:putative transposase